MKNIRIYAFIIALLMLAGSMVACGGGAAKTVNCKVSVIVDGEAIVDGLECPVKTAGDKEPVVLDAVEMALDYLSVEYETSETGLIRLKMDGVEYAKGTDKNGVFWFWNCLVNDVEPETGSAATIKIADGDDIKYVFTALESESTENEATEIVEDENTDEADD